jgi:hypothetical protein
MAAQMRDLKTNKPLINSGLSFYFSGADGTAKYWFLLFYLLPQK